MKSWKTTLAGALALLALLAAQASVMLDGKPETVPDWGLAVAGIMGFVAAYNARDKDVSSEDEGVN